MIPISKRKNKISIKVVGGNAEHVTGSASLITFEKRNVLFEFGMIQSGRTIYDNYRENQNLISTVKSSSIDYIFIGHCHCDHIGLIPALYGRNCSAVIIAPKGSSHILKEMWLDSAYINQRDADILTLQQGKTYFPLFTEKDVNAALDHIQEYDFHEIIELDENISFRFTYAGHISLSAQTELFIKISNHIKKILFTSDLGNIMLKDSKIFVEPFEAVTSANIVIGEATYASPARRTKKQDLQLDLDKIHTVVQQYCVDNHNIVVIPCFALDRLPYMLWILYSLFSQDKSFTIPVIVDSPLGIRLLKAYKKIMNDTMLEKYNQMLSWPNIKLITEATESKAVMADGKPKVVIASAGMLTAGRSVKWVQHIIPNPDDCLLFIGYAATNTLAYKIKHGKDIPTISIAGKSFKNRCQIVDLHSFSSHQQRDDLLHYYSQINCEKIYLVHSNQEDKMIFKSDLEKLLTEKCKTTKVIAVNRSTIISL